MTDLDALPFANPDSRPNLGAAPARKVRRHRHEWCRSCIEFGVASHCLVPGCGIFQDDPRIRAGRSSARLGKDQERRIERVYGPRKIGERGDPVDHIGRVWRWQSKATRSAPPLWLAAISEPVQPARLPGIVTLAWVAMGTAYEPRERVVIRSFVSNGLRTRDWLFVDYRAARDQLGLPGNGLAWWVIPGDWWLDHFGRDEALRELPAYTERSEK